MTGNCFEEHFTDFLEVIGNWENEYIGHKNNMDILCSAQSHYFTIFLIGADKYLKKDSPKI